MNHLFGDLVSQHLHRKHGLSQAKLADGIAQDPSIVGKMCKGQRLAGMQARQRVVAIIGWLRTQEVLTAIAEANQLLTAACMPPLCEEDPVEALLLGQLLGQHDFTLTYPHQPTNSQKTNLPIPLTSFVGRSQELLEIKQLLCRTDGSRRLITLTGVGGCGKTRLALQAAKDLLEAFAEGVWWVDLTALTDGALLPRTIAKALGLKGSDEEQLPQLLANFLSQRHLLLVIDNCEHLIDACRSLIAGLLSQAAGLQILTTSREPLHVAGENIWQVPTLSLSQCAADEIPTCAEIDRLLRADCVRLFVERASAVQSGFHLSAENARSVVNICEQLDGIPLAIELAAARVRLFTVEQIADYLQRAVGARFELLKQKNLSLHPRQQTLLAAIDWSYNLLDEAERQLFRQVAVFQGGFTFEALEQIAEIGVPRAQMEAGAHGSSTVGSQFAIRNSLDLLSQLIDKSLVIAEPNGRQQRYRLLETLREYALNHFLSNDELESVQKRHAKFFLQLAENAAPALQTMDQKLWLERLTQEYSNLQTALVWFEKSAQFDIGLQLAKALSQFWRVRGYFREGQRWLEIFLQHCADESKLGALHIDAKNALATLYGNQSDFGLAQTMFEQNLILARGIAYIVGVEDALIGLGAVGWELADYHRAASIMDEAVQQCRATQHIPQLTRALNNRGLIHWSQGNLAAAIDSFSEALIYARQSGNPGGLSAYLYNLANMRSHQGDYAESRRLYEESIAVSRQLGDEASIADVLLNLGQLELHLGEFKVATSYLQEAAEINRKLGDQADIAYSNCNLGDIAFYTGQYEQAQHQYLEALLLFRKAGNKRMLGRTLAGLGQVACRIGELTTAVAFCSEALSLRHTIGHKAGILFSFEGGVVELAIALRQPVIAARLLAATDVLYEELSLTRPPIKVKMAEQLRVQVQTQLGTTAFAKAWDEGQAMSLDQAVAHALEMLTPNISCEDKAEVRFIAFGPARVYRGQKLLTAADWVYDKARELVFFLLCYPDATQAEIGLHFWPDASPEQVRKRFSAALSHARNALGRERGWIIRHEGRYRIDLLQTAWFDVAIFEAKIKAAKVQLNYNQSPEQAMPLLQEAIELYHGDFLEDLLEGEWPQRFRSALLQSYLDTLLMLAGIYIAAKKFECAIPIYQQALAKDPYLEEAHISLMRAYVQINQRGQALRQYDVLIAALDDLGVTPSTETQTLIGRLRRNEPI